MLTMPAGHTQGELDLAHAVAHRLGSTELHVFWSPAPPVTRRTRSERRYVVRAFEALGRFLERL